MEKGSVFITNAFWPRIVFGHFVHSISCCIHKWNTRNLILLSQNEYFVHEMDFVIDTIPIVI